MKTPTMRFVKFQLANYNYVTKSEFEVWLIFDAKISLHTDVIGFWFVTYIFLCKKLADNLIRFDYL